MTNIRHKTLHNEEFHSAEATIIGIRKRIYHNKFTEKKIAIQCPKCGSMMIESGGSLECKCGFIMNFLEDTAFNKWLDSLYFAQKKGGEED